MKKAAARALACGLLVLPGSMPAETQIEEPAAPVVDTVDVRVVNVEVVVTDRAGRPALGLRAGDFELFEDGAPVAVTYFRSPEEGPAAAPASEAAAVAGEADAADAHQANAAEDAGLTLVVYFDEQHLRPANRERVRRDLGDFLRTFARPGVRFVLAVRRAGVTFEPVVADAGQVVAQLEALPAAAAVGVEAEMARRRALGEIGAYHDGVGLVTGSANVGNDPCERYFEEMAQVARLYAANVEARDAAAFQGVREVLAAIAGLEGRKALLFVSDGVNVRPGVEMFEYLAELCSPREREVRRLQNELQTITRLEQVATAAAASRVLLYPLDAQGVPGVSGVDPSFASATLAPSEAFDTVLRNDLHSALSHLADASGGRALLNANRPFDAIADLFDEVLATYSLGFTPARPPSGLVHRLEARLRARPELRLRYRRSYQDKTLDDRLGERLFSALLLGAEANPLGVVVETLPLEPVTGGGGRVPVKIAVPRAALLTIEGASGDQVGAKVRVFLQALPERGGRTPIRQRVFDLSWLPTAAAAAVRHELVVRFELPRGRHQLAVGVRDELSQETAYLRRAVDVP